MLCRLNLSSSILLIASTIILSFVAMVFVTFVFAKDQRCHYNHCILSEDIKDESYNSLPDSRNLSQLHFT